MKKRTMIPLAFAAMMIYGCAGSTETMEDTTAMDETTTMSETQTMAGSATDTDTDMSTTTTDTYSTTTTSDLSASDIIANANTNVNYSDMFSDISDTKQHDIMALARQSPELSTFVTLMEKAELTDVFTDGEFTVFAPTNAAFASMDQAQLDMLLKPENKTKLSQILQAHVLPNKVSAATFNSSQRIQVSDDSFIPVDVTMNGTNVTVGGATIVRNNVEASNGYLHIVDGVIMPTENTGTQNGIK
jgi:uncharacterized surface protein with fasciclin (FAS1) repeats